MILFKKYRDRKAKEIQERKAWVVRSKKDAEMAIDAARTQMLSLACPFRGLERCSFDCVHWKGGRVVYFPDWRDRSDGYYYAARPVCRLWGEK